MESLNQNVTNLLYGDVNCSALSCSSSLYSIIPDENNNDIKNNMAKNITHANRSHIS